MVVYSVLTTDSDTQYVRVYSTYNPAGSDPSENQDETSVTNAQVTISQGGGPSFAFQPTTIQRPDTSRYSSSIGAYYAYPFRPEEGKKYSLTISSQLYGVARSTLTVPSRGFISAENELLLKDPWNVPLDDIALSISLSPVAKGYLVRFYLDYEMLDSSGWRTARVEVPIAVRQTPDGHIIEYVFPDIQRRVTSTNGSPYAGPGEHFVYLTDAYRKTVEAVLASASSIRFKQDVFLLIQFDEPLYNYYFVANGFKDRSSIRLDEPNYTNLSGGVGIFGSLAVDSIAVPLPERFPPPRSH
jgi:hypothetical protein